ncbi:MAG: DUF1295 domain-containing protein [Oligoflexia bacterium]|nr:DUF1295 domain-containing protein [Oligoflexia bacterium]MBF0367511.1 DUF1295 domain-containing protein [Oligoflexia bacterium]
MWISLLCSFLFFQLLFLLAIKKKDNSIVDVGWGVSFIISMLPIFFLLEKVSFLQFAVFVLVILWGLRLSWHIFRRKVGQPEDYRYAKWRTTWSHFYLRSYLQIYLLQWILMLIISTPVYLLLQSKTYLPWSFLGIAIALFGFLYETIADWQLTRFRNNSSNRGTIIKSGLWRYSRHPNYFGEISFWWGIGLAAYFAQSNWLAFIGPLTITILLIFVSGIPLMEEHLKNRPDFILYKKNTPLLIPSKCLLLINLRPKVKIKLM